MQIRIVFMGSPEFAVPVLRKLADSYPIIGVITQPDRPAGRGRIFTPPAIKEAAEDLHLPFIQPRKLSETDTLQQLNLWAPDLVVVAAYGQILRSAVLDLPKFGCINVHASLLPRWRGAAPIQASIMHGDVSTGISIMRMDSGIDTGPILSQKSLNTDANDTTGSLTKKLSDLGANLLLQTLPEYLSGRLVPKPQDETSATYAPMIKKADSLLDFSKPAIDLERVIRAFNPWPGAFTYWNNQILKIHRAHVVEFHAGKVGMRITYQECPAITTSNGLLVLDELQLAGRNIQSGKVFLRGYHSWMV